jgi:nucleotide-binding universal stress UspA family protein
VYSTIVVGTDGSDTATAAVQRAEALAEMTRGELVILHAIRLSAVGDFSGGVAVPDPVVLMEEGKELLARAEKGIHGKIPVRTVVRRGDPARSLIDTAKKEQADLLVVGSRGMQGARRILGSVPNAVAHGAPCDVLIVHTT